MSIDATLEMARAGRLYPSVILHGADDGRRRDAAVELGRALLCERSEVERPCGACGQCRRISVDPSEQRFHPDFHLLERDQKTVTSIDATRRFLQSAQMAPYESRGQVFVITAAETLGPDAADTLLKILEEPPPRTPRHFFLLSPSNRELPSTLRSRSMSLFLGGEAPVDEQRILGLSDALTACLRRYLDSGAAVHLLTAASEIERTGDWRDLRAAAPWSLAASAAVRSSQTADLAPVERRALLELAAALLAAPAHRLRGITQQRILEGLVVRHLGVLRRTGPLVAGP